MYTRLCSSVLFPLHERLKGHHTVALLRELEQSQWWSTERIAETQAERLRTFLTEVGRHVPYYRRLFQDHEFDPGACRSVADLSTLPRLDKQAIRANMESLKSEHAGTLVRYNTGGSTGEPLVFYMGTGRISHDVAAKWRATRWWGVDIGDVEVVLWGSPIELGKQDRIKALRDRLFRSHLLPAFQMSETQMDLYLDTIRRLRPRMLFGYASVLALLAEYSERREQPMDDLGIKVAFATGETLYPNQRAVIERVFRAPVANGYGSRDAGFVAHQCPEGALHLTAEHIVVEIADASGFSVAPGEPGEILVTHLATHDFPLVRYRTGDQAVAAEKPCPCGRGLPLLAEVLGRSTDFIRTVSGNTMHALALIYEVRDQPGVRAFKFIQHADLSIELLLVAGADLTDQVESTIRSGLTKRLGAETPLIIRRVDAIPAEKSGKHRYVVSHADSPTRPGRRTHAC